MHTFINIQRLLDSKIKHEENGVLVKIIDASELTTVSAIEIAELNLKKVHEVYALCLKQIELAKEQIDGKSTSDLNIESTNENVDSTIEEQNDSIELSNDNQNELESYKIQRKKKDPSKLVKNNVNVSPTTLIPEKNECHMKKLETEVVGQTKKTGIDAYIIRRKQKIQCKVMDPKVSPTTSTTEQDDSKGSSSNVTQKQLFSSNKNNELVDLNKSSTNITKDKTIVSSPVTNVRTYWSFDNVILSPTICLHCFILFQ